MDVEKSVEVEFGRCGSSLGVSVVLEVGRGSGTVFWGFSRGCDSRYFNVDVGFLES